MNKQMADSVDHTKDGNCSGCGQCCSCLLILSEGEIAKIKNYKPLDHNYKKIVNMVETFMNKECSNAPDIKELNKMYQEKKREAGIK